MTRKTVTDMARPEFYYRDFPSNVLPARTPFTRPGRGDAGLLFIYVSNRQLRWSLLLAKDRVERIYPEARKQIADLQRPAADRIFDPHGTCSQKNVLGRVQQYRASIGSVFRRLGDPSRGGFPARTDSTDTVPVAAPRRQAYPRSRTNHPTPQTWRHLAS